jgi:NAD(P)-dependent dehydrogenase (short-subunit alcohol dehydrogenase family)/acyl carrier protein
LVAAWLIERGARNLMLVGRSGASPEAESEIERMRATGARIHVATVDISSGKSVRSLFSTLQTDLPPLRGVFHSAGVLDDGTLAQQDWVRFESVMAPKVKGAWLLHELTRKMPLDHFVLFSSIASLLGSAGQGNHAAANAFLDALAHYRREHGLCGLSINWGVWSEIGAGARHGVDRNLSDLGLDVISPKQGLIALEKAMRMSVAQVGITPANWTTFLGRNRDTARRPFFAEMVRELRRDVSVSAIPRTAHSDVVPNILEQLKSAFPNKRKTLLLRHVQACVTQILGLPSSASFDRLQPVTEMGMDSLMAVELRNLLRQSLNMALPATLVFDYPSVQAITEFLAHELFGLQGAEGSAQKGADKADDILSMIENISDDDAERLLSENQGRARVD